MLANNNDSSMSRRDLVAAIGVGVAGLAVSLVAPTVAFAEDEINAEMTVDELWADAEAKALENGDPIFYRIKPHENPIPLGVKRTGTVSGGTTVGTIPDQITAVAVYDVNDSNRIWHFYDGWVHGTQSTVTNSYYDYTIADGGRSLVMNYTATLRNIFGFSQTFRIYASFGPSGGSFIRINYA
ncbi:hypothetical protein JI75_01760 [Berryella intestinalis]|uniref:Uncharacterized protein n=1 Tax=Berryella intestinalis TaxID=1531429 RepID=A0A0A8B2I9_9ACTN|nr:hypothetical protein [Berryella intestinalis]AJC11600.1 hypothetical protein JI75_01760 [Berryella intestinalis]MDD7369915.1 hypothetical protein [Berryella intestinalis]